VSGSVAVSYNADYRVASQKVNGQNEVTFGHDPDGLLTSAGDLTLVHDPASGFLSGTQLGSVSDQYGYSSYGELASYSATRSGSVLYGAEFTRDDAGRITRKVETIGGTTNTWTYEYDQAGRLNKVDRDSGLYASYTYDGNSNRLTAADPFGSFAGAYDNQDRLLSYGSSTYAYTADGEVRSRAQGGQTVTYSYDVMGNLRGVGLPDGVTIDYVIDAANRRVGKRVDGELVKGWLYAGQLTPVAELDGAGSVVSRFVYGTGGNVPDYMVRAGVEYRIISDSLGSVRLVVNAADGSIAQRLDYDPFGRVTLDTSPGFQPFGFAGGLYDYQTGLVRFGARDYDAATGRWTSRDPLGLAGGDTNLYGYVLADPTNAIDPTGLESWLSKHSRQIATISAGIGDGLLWIFGDLGPKIRGLNGLVDQCSGDYEAARFAGQAVAVAAVAAGAIEGMLSGPAAAEAAGDAAAIETESGAANAANGARLGRHLTQLEEYGEAGFRELENGRFRYYSELEPASKPGEMAGRRLVREWDPATDYTRTWHEVLDHSGNVRIVRPVTGGPKIHYFFGRNGGYQGSW
jgi:RHS repeat-associated protein